MVVTEGMSNRGELKKERDRESERCCLCRGTDTARKHRAGCRSPPSTYAASREDAEEKESDGKIMHCWARQAVEYRKFIRVLIPM